MDEYIEINGDWDVGTFRQQYGTGCYIFKNNDRIVYFKNGERHRSDGPAWINFYKSGAIESETYYLNGARHRDDGPAWIYYSAKGVAKKKEYWLNGNYVDPSDYFKYMETCATFQVKKDHIIEKYKIDFKSAKANKINRIILDIMLAEETINKIIYNATNIGKK